MTKPKYKVFGNTWKFAHEQICWWQKEVGVLFGPCQIQTNNVTKLGLCAMNIYIFCNTLVASTKIILFLKMLRFSKKKFKKPILFWWRNFFWEYFKMLFYFWNGIFKVDDLAGTFFSIIKWSAWTPCGNTTITIQCQNKLNSHRYFYLTPYLTWDCN